jgi:hypothetical protein
VNPYGNYISNPNENTLCECNEDYQEFSDYINEESYSFSESNERNMYQCSYSDGDSESNYSLEDNKSLIDGKGHDWRQDIHDIYLQAAEFKQVTVKQMKNNTLVETRQDYSVNCTLCGKVITMELEHNCIVGYGLGQIHPEMKPEALVNEVFWEIPEAVQQ